MSSLFVFTIVEKKQTTGNMKKYKYIKASMFVWVSKHEVRGYNAYEKCVRKGHPITFAVRSVTETAQNVEVLLIIS